jgi:hypothetical protein
MLVKRIVYYVLAAGPFLLIGLIAINSRLNANHWEFVEYGPETTLRIEAYSRPVEMVRNAIVKGRPVSTEELRKTIDAWLEGSRRGDLRDIYPPTTQVDGSAVIYDQIVRAKQTLVDNALRYGHVLQSQGRTREAALVYADVFELADVGKYSELSALCESATYQSSTLKRIAQLAGSLSAEDRSAILARLSSLDRSPERTLSQIVDRLCVTYARDLERQGRSAAPIEAARDHQRLASNEDPLESRIKIWERISSSDQLLTPLSSRSRIALAQETRYESQLATAVAALGASSN